MAEVDLSRFLDAQASVYDAALAELRAGRKRSHWMWFVFPQVAGLGRSSAARRYAISSSDEARAYLAHPVLGSRLRECVRLVLAVSGLSAEEIFGGIDAVKLRSSMTLFAHSTSDNTDFLAVLETYYGGAEDQLTLELLSRSGLSG